MYLCQPISPPPYSLVDFTAEYTIIVKTLDTREVLTINTLSLLSSTLDLKHVIQQVSSTRPHPDYQRIIFKGRPLPDDYTLYKSGLLNRDTVYFIPNMRGD